MKKKYFVIPWLLLIVSISAQEIGPKIYSPDTEYSFGNIVEGSIVTHDFKIINNGDAELYLIKVNSTCGCTVAKPAKEKLQPGESTKLTVSFNSKNRSGRQKKFINVFNNDKTNTRYRLSIQANVISKEQAGAKPGKTARIKVDKNQHNFGNAKEGTVLTWDLPIKSIGDTTLVISDVQTSCGCTAALLSEDRLKPGETGNIRIELDTSRMKGKKSRTIAVVSNDPYNPRMVITLFVDVEPNN